MSIPTLDGIPRRARLDLNTPAEIAIRGAIHSVEAAGADVRLTDAVVLLGGALDSVADFVDGIDTRRYVHTHPEILGGTIGPGAFVTASVTVTLEDTLRRLMDRKEQADAVAAVLAERQRQDQKWGGPEHDDRHNADDFREFIRYQLDALPYEISRACDREEYDEVVRRRFIKIAALAVAAVEMLARFDERMKSEERVLADKGLVE